MERSVDILIYFYMFICVSLLAFNIAYIVRAKGKSRRRLRQEQKWLDEMEQEWGRIVAGKPVSVKHLRRLETKLEKIELLMAYHEAVQKGMELYPDGRVQCYLDQCDTVFLELAVNYGRKPAMERAFYAYLLAAYHPNRGESGLRFSQILLTYFPDSTVFCRENILYALYAFGQESAVERAFSIMNDRGWYHHPRLLSDGLATFYGDRTALAWKLWHKRQAWGSSFQVAIVQFATERSDEFSQAFLTALKDHTTDLELRFAILRYFRRRVYPPAKTALLELLGRENNDLAIVAATALASYPGEDTRQALMDAMRSRNWYVRRNAAETLVALGVSWSEVEKLSGEDRYGAEMLEYLLARAGAAASVDTKKEAVKA